jgi:hypothetical protein
MTAAVGVDETEEPDFSYRVKGGIYLSQVGRARAARWLELRASGSARLVVAARAVGS